MIVEDDVFEKAVVRIAGEMPLSEDERTAALHLV
jgi:hypothetical protein